MSRAQSLSSYEPDHYELLEIPRDATREEVERAYRMARATWSEEGLATYSVAERGELAGMRARVELADRVLVDVETRSAYDEALGLLSPPPEEPELDFDDEEKKVAPELPAEIESFDDLSGPEDGRWSGAALRRSRLARGLELEQLTAVTKVNPVYLRCIE